ncbi:MAG TPA: MarR family transcriptional regulator [Mobilitalea sp.]|nr:MarR family transcriptional regulator [Mobilitalea sp.]
MDDNAKIIEQIESYYNSWFEINNIYHIWAIRHGIQETTLFVLYVIKNTEPYCTQSDICKKLLLPKQTVSKILSNLEHDEYILKEPNSKDRRNRIIRYTEKGTQYATLILEELKFAEINAFHQMSQKQCVNIVESFRLLSDSLLITLS